MITIFTDGGSRGNPGPAAYGVYITGEMGELASLGKYIGENTNNVAEYTAVVEAFNWLLFHKKDIQDNDKIQFYMDSQLICNQLTGVYKVKHPQMQGFYYTLKEKEKELGIPVFYTHIPREKNKRADYLVNLALDNASMTPLQ